MNWPNLLADLRSWKVTQQEIAAHCGVTQSTVSELYLGKIKQPSFMFGTKLVELHALEQAKQRAAALRETYRDREALPRRRRAGVPTL